MLGVVDSAARAVALVLATDFGFISYYKEARGALAVAEQLREQDVTVGPEAELGPTVVVMVCSMGT